jgi:hypothetical protein
MAGGSCLGSREDSPPQSIAFTCVWQQRKQKIISYRMTDRYIEYFQAHLSQRIRLQCNSMNFIR